MSEVELKVTCPCCGADITDAAVEAINAVRRHMGGKSMTAKRAAYLKEHARQMSAAMTPERRRAAAQKRIETMRQKREASQN